MPRWVGVQDVFGVVAGFLSPFDLPPLAAGNSQCAWAVKPLLKAHCDEVSQLLAAAKGRGQVLKEYGDACISMRATGIELGQGEQVLRFRLCINEFTVSILTMLQQIRIYELGLNLHARRVFQLMEGLTSALLVRHTREHRAAAARRRFHAQAALRLTKLSGGLRPPAADPRLPDALARRAASGAKRDRVPDAGSSRQRAPRPRPAPPTGGRPRGGGGRPSARQSASGRPAAAVRPAAAAPAAPAAGPPPAKRRRSGPAAATHRPAPAPPGGASRRPPRKAS
eukprot:TRINITY_DN5976_c0_g1_i1.p1 TRINITY_DN5976_c0_g1~~TRINITY_DN5976_c0_g1_i1.p1  ORF type:complete len:325 (+),score=57.40 TRINITY_DN5976_c0_g1_i1:132-977(+)